MYAVIAAETVPTAAPGQAGFTLLVRSTPQRAVNAGDERKKRG